MATSLSSYLFISTALFLVGVYVIMSRRNLVAILMGIELILNSAALNFVAFSRFSPNPANYAQGQIFAIFVIVLAAAETVVALAITIAVYKYFRGINVDQANMLRG